MQLCENAVDAQTFCALRRAVGWGEMPLLQAEKALQNSLYTVCAVENGETVGMCRLVGDGVSIFYIQDVIVLPACQGKGIGRKLVEALLAYVRAEALPDTRVAVGLMAAKGKEGFYNRLGFDARPNERFGPGMQLFIQKGGT